MLGHVALGTWSGGRFMHFGQELPEARLEALLCPDDGIHTLLTADTYGAGAADRLLGRALAGVPRERFELVGAIGHDFYEGERDGPRGFPRFTDPRLRAPDGYRDYVRMAVERSLERCGVDAFDVLLLHNPDRRGFEHPAVWDALREVRDQGLTRQVGLAPGPANGFTLDVIGCLERYGELIDWAMLILNPLEPWPGELALPAAARNDVNVITRVVDYGGFFHGDVRPGHAFARNDHRGFRPDGWVEAAWSRYAAMEAIRERHGLTMLQFACTWNLAQPAVACVAPTLIQEGGEDARSIEAKREELAGVPAEAPFSAEELRAIRAAGDNHGSMLLKGATPDHEGEERPDRWAVESNQRELAERFGIDPERDLRKAA
jgi:aryl-alcohol dehydrogenase-like predicted oxidoreductase